MGISYTDAELFLLIKQNDRKAFDYIYARYTPLLKRVIMKMDITDIAANNLLAQIFFDTWASIDQYNPASQPFYIWMHRMTRKKGAQYILDTAVAVSVLSHSMNKDKHSLHFFLATSIN